MSKQVNVICQNALQKVGIEMDEGAALGSYAVPALSDLNSVVTELNTQNLILQNIETVDVHASKKITFAVLPEEFHIVDKVSDLTTDMLNAYNLNDIVYVKEEDKYYYIDYGHRKFRMKMKKHYVNCGQQSSANKYFLTA